MIECYKYCEQFIFTIKNIQILCALLTRTTRHFNSSNHKTRIQDITSSDLAKIAIYATKGFIFCFSKTSIKSNFQTL